jgi:hypothetical protein
MYVDISNKTRVSSFVFVLLVTVLAACGKEKQSVTVTQMVDCEATTGRRQLDGIEVFPEGEIPVGADRPTGILDILDPGVGARPSGVADLRNASLGAAVLLIDSKTRKQVLIVQRVCEPVELVTKSGPVTRRAYVVGGNLGVKVGTSKVSAGSETDFPSIISGMSQPCGSGQVVDIDGVSSFVIDGRWCGFDESGNLLFDDGDGQRQAAEAMARLSPIKSAGTPTLVGDTDIIHTMDGYDDGYIGG